MSRIFLSHSSKNNDSAVALRDWLAAQGWDDVFLDLDPGRGIAAGDRWERALNQAALRCEAVLFLVSREWLASDWCQKEFNLANRLNKRLFGLLIEDIPIGDLPATLTGTWQLVPLAGGRDHVMLRAVLPGTHDEVHVTFSQEGLTRLRIGLERAGLDARFFAWPPTDDGQRAPFRGLLPLEAADAGIFFGREAPTIEALDRIRGIKDSAAPRLLVLLGASGAGKSSFLRAGLLPRLARDDRNYLPLPVVRPESASINGENGLLRSIEVALAARGIPRPRAEIRAAIEGGAAQFRPLLQSLVAQATLTADEPGAKAPTLVFAIDQGEEFFGAEGASDRAALLALLRDLLEHDNPAALVLIAIRSDSYEQLQTAKALEGITQQTLSLTPMPRGAYQAVIEGPAARLKHTNRPLVIEPTLTQALLFDIEEGGGRDALPLLAFTLERLYLEYGARGRLTLHDYDALGRIKGSIEAAVERAFGAADSDARIPRDREARLALLRRGLIPWLAGIDSETGSPRRQKARQSEIPEEARPLIEFLVEERLLSTDTNQETGERTIEPAHEALLRQWGSLKGWLQEDFAALTNLETIKRAARDWAANAKSEDWLAHRAGRLEAAKQLLRRPDLAENLGPTDQLYLSACIEREERERREKTTTLERQLEVQRRFKVVAIIAALIFAGVGLYAFVQKSNAEMTLREAKISQGRFLSQQATLALDNNDPVTAIDLALEALPGPGGDDTPYVAAAGPALFAGFSQLRERRILSGHRGSVLSAAFSTDGLRVVTASEDQTARVWNAVTGAEVALLKGHEKDVYSATFSADGTRVLTASADGTAGIWDAATGVLIKQLKGHKNKVRRAVFNPDGTRIVTASDDGTARVWDAVTGAQVALLEGHENGLNSAMFSADGTRIVTASDDGTARVWNAATGKQIARLAGHGDLVRDAAFNPDGRRVVTASFDATARVWDAITGAQIALLEGHKGWVIRAAFSSDGTRIVTASFDGTARIWNALSGAPIAVLKGHDNLLLDAAFSADGAQILTASRDATARVWNTLPMRQTILLKGHEDGVITAAFNSDGKRVVTASFDRTARIWDAITGAQITLLQGHDDYLTSAAFSPDGERVVTASKDKTARIWDTSTGAQIAILKGHGDQVVDAAFSVDGKQIVTASLDKTARVWDAITGRQIALLEGHKDFVVSASFSGDGKRVATASVDGTARIWDAVTGKQITLLKGDGVYLNGVAFSPDGARVVAPEGLGKVQVWNSITGEQTAVFKGHESEVTSAVFSPDGTRVLTASDDNTARIWNAVSGTQIAVLTGHDSGLLGAAFSSDGTRIVTSSADHTARVWDSATGEQIALLEGHENEVTSAVFSPDGTRVVTASRDNTARVWDAPGTLDALIRTARKSVPRCLTRQQRDRYFLPTKIPNWCHE
jgi:WD40 repeat protein